MTNLLIAGLIVSSVFHAAKIAAVKTGSAIIWTVNKSKPAKPYVAHAADIASYYAITILTRGHH